MWYNVTYTTQNSMSKTKPTTEVLAVMIDSLTKATETRDKVHETILRDIKDGQKEHGVHLRETKEQVYDVKTKVMRLQDKIIEMETKIEDNSRKIIRTSERLGFLEKWYWKIVGGVAVLGIIMPFIWSNFIQPKLVEHQINNALNNYEEPAK